MKILGVDPGLAKTGYGIVEKLGNKLILIKCGCIKTEKGVYTKRLKNIYNEILTIIKDTKPEAIAIEQLFFCKNVKTALKIGEVRGIIMLAGIMSNIEIYEYTPLQVKQSVTGYGKAGKEQVHKMVKVLLGLKELPKPVDISDALAISICHINSYNLKNLMKQ